MKTDVVRFRLSPDERMAFEEAASLSGIALSAWMRERLRKACRRELEEAGVKIAFLRSRKE